jgi:hypothetical protein
MDYTIINKTMSDDELVSLFISIHNNFGYDHISKIDFSSYVGEKSYFDYAKTPIDVSSCIFSVELCRFINSSFSVIFENTDQFDTAKDNIAGICALITITLVDKMSHVKVDLTNDPIEVIRDLCWPVVDIMQKEYRLLASVCLQLVAKIDPMKSLMIMSGFAEMESLFNDLSMAPFVAKIGGKNA